MSDAMPSPNFALEEEKAWTWAMLEDALRIQTFPADFPFEDFIERARSVFDVVFLEKRNLEGVVSHNQRLLHCAIGREIRLLRLEQMLRDAGLDPGPNPDWDVTNPKPE